MNEAGEDEPLLAMLERIGKKRRDGQAPLQTTAPAASADTEALAAEDDWAVAVSDISGAEDAAAARANLRQSLKSGSITSERFQQVLAAIDARGSALNGASA
jgi:hypothetical protein